MNTTATKTDKTFYTPHGWAGSRYSRDFSMNDITKMIRNYIKINHPGCTFSVTKPHYSSININLMSAPFDVFSTPDAMKIPLNRIHHSDSVKNIMDEWANLPTRGNHGVNHYYIADDFMLTDKAREVMADVYAFAKSFNYDDSDAMTDYFDTNFYMSMGIGKWDRPFIRK